MGHRLIESKRTGQVHDAGGAAETERSSASNCRRGDHRGAKSKSVGPLIKQFNNID